MIKLSIPQAKALARKLSLKIQENRSKTEKAIKDAIRETAEYKSLLIDTEATLRSFAKLIETYGLDKDYCGIKFTGYNYSNFAHYLEKPDGLREYAKELCESWVYDKAQPETSKLKWVSESDLVDDIILEAIEAEDLNDLMNKFLTKYD